MKPKQMGRRMARAMAAAEEALRKWRLEPAEAQSTVSLNIDFNRAQ
jgi:hypothetical protein